MLPPEELWSIFSEFDDESTWDQTTVSSCEDFDGPRTPRVLKNDIRRHFSGSFINAINSGSFDQAQAFSKAFIAHHCAVTWYMSAGAAARANLPVNGTLYGPDQFLHFVLGCWVTFPDLVLSQVSSRIVSFGGALGRTTLMLNVDIAATRTAFLPCDLWLPPSSQLSVLYTASTAFQLRAMVNRFHWLSMNGTDKSIHPHFSEQRVHTTCSVSSRYRAVTITEPFVHALHQSAVPVLQPTDLHLTGHFCFEFDEQNRIVQMSLCFVLG